MSKETANAEEKKFVGEETKNKRLNLFRRTSVAKNVTTGVTWVAFKMRLHSAATMHLCKEN